MSIVTISASYGAGGSVIAPAVAARLGLPFLDRAIPVAVAERLAVAAESALGHDERVDRGLGRLVTLWARLPTLTGVNIPLPPEGLGGEEGFRQHTEAVVREMAQTTGGVILGRAAAIVLRARPDALHVRLDGPADARIRQGMRLEGIDEETARIHQRQTDAAREAAFRHFYRRRPSDPALYHLMLDSTALPLDLCTDLIVRTAEVRHAVCQQPGQIVT